MEIRNAGKNGKAYFLREAKRRGRPAAICRRDNPRGMNREMHATHDDIQGRHAALDDIHAARDDIRLTAMIYHCFRNG